MVKVPFNRYTFLQMMTGLIIGFVLGATLMSTASVMSIWELDTYPHTLKVAGTTKSFGMLDTCQLDPDGVGVDAEGWVQSLKPTVLSEWSSLRHVDSQGNPTPYDEPDTTFQTATRDHSIHYFEFDVLTRTIANRRDAWIVIPPIPPLFVTQTLAFPYYEHDQVQVEVHTRIAIQPEAGKDDCHVGWGNAYVVSSRGITYNPNMDGTYEGVWDEIHSAVMPAENSKCNVVKTITDTDVVKDYIVSTWSTLEAGVEYAYHTDGIHITGVSGVQNVGVMQTIRFSLDLSRPLIVDPKDDPLDPIPDLSGEKDVFSVQWLGIIGIVVGVALVFIIILQLLKRRATVQTRYVQVVA